MFQLTVIVYPCVLALLCTGAGLCVDRASGRVLPGLLVLPVGAALLIGVSQLTTASTAFAPLTPAVFVVLALAGLALGRQRLRAFAARCASEAGIRLQLGTCVLVYLLAIAPVLLSGQPSFSSFMTLTDSAYHMLGASYMIEHGRSFAHVDLFTSYGRVLTDYFGSSYPTGADTFFGGSDLLLGLPTIWAFQPFNAFVLATAAAPAFLLVKRVGLDGWWAALAALTASLPALVYGYELIASVKEVAALPILLSLGALLVLHRGWLTGKPRGVIPFAVLVAAGISTEGIGFAVWVLVALLVLACVAVEQVRRRAWTVRAVLASAACGTVSILVLAWTTWERLPGEIEVAKAITSTLDPGNLQKPLEPVQMLGSWLSGSYLTPPSGSALALTYALVAITALAAAIGIVEVLRRRHRVLAAWLLGAILVWIALTAYSTTWVDAKGLVLTSPVVILMAWMGIAALRSWRKTSLRLPAALLAAAIALGVLASDALQYHDSDLAPTARYEELASLNKRFARQGPTLFTGFDEYSLYELRSLEVGGPDFLYPPPAVARAAGGHSQPVDLQRAKPSAVARYRLIVTQPDPLASRPPAAYQLLWHGTYYEVWGRRPSARTADLAVSLQGAHRVSCRVVSRIARRARARRADLVADTYPHVIPLRLNRVRLPHRWTRSGPELLINTPGTLSTRFRLRHAGRYRLWLSGEMMPALRVRIDGHLVGSIGDQISGNGDSPDPMVPIRVALAAGQHSLTITRTRFSLAPGNGGTAYLEGGFLTRADAGGRQRLETVAPSHWHQLCGQRLDWIEAVPIARGRGRGARGRGARGEGRALAAGARALAVGAGTLAAGWA